MQIGCQCRELRRPGCRRDPHHLVLLHVARGIHRQRMASALDPARSGDRRLCLGVTEEREREVNVLHRGRLAAALFAHLRGPFAERLRRLARRPQREEQPHYSTKCWRMRAASAVSSCSSSAVTISCISRRPRFCESFQRVSSRVTGIWKLTMPFSMPVTYFASRASNFGSHCGSMAATSRRCEACFAALSSMSFGTP